MQEKVGDGEMDEVYGERGEEVREGGNGIEMV